MAFAAVTVFRLLRGQVDQSLAFEISNWHDSPRWPLLLNFELQDSGQRSQLGLRSQQQALDCLEVW